MDSKNPKNIPEKLLSPYSSENTEARIYEMWDKDGLFSPEGVEKVRKETKNTPHFSIVLPPPNVTGTLHMGHALGLSIEDVMVRFHRMLGERTLWVPGTDHAAIATQAKVEKDISKKEGKNRYDIGRDEMVRRINEFASESHDTIVSQLKAMGASLDWSREAYTLDEKRNLAVRTAFKKMYDEGLIYRGERIVNWDPKGQTTISDDEIVYTEEKTKLYYLKYGPFTIGTSRPETKFGDKYVVVHPDDVRYKKFTHGQKLDVEWINGNIEATVIKDTSIDMEFGTGAMTITPWHSLADFDLAEKYELDKEQIIDRNGKLLPVAEEFAGMKIKDAREKIIEKLQAKGLLEKVEDYTHNIATAERTGGTIEPQIMKQWFVAVNKEFVIPHSEIPGISSGSKTTLKEIMRQAVKSGAVAIMPDYFDKTYFHWIDNLRDWCISRQIWFGHRIPVWYTADDIYCDLEAPGGPEWVQDEDTLDTWFSSALWTFSTLGWPENTDDLKKFHPTTVLETGYEILFFWVARMILMSGYFLGTVPFKQVYLHGTVRDKEGLKMSKSLNNGIDPLDMIAKYGADAVRMSLVMGTAPGTDSRIFEEKIKGQKHFANKLWNIARFVFSNSDFTESKNISYEDEIFLDSLKTMTKDVTEDMSAMRLHLAAEKLYAFVWHEFADVFLEESKKRLASLNEEEKMSAAFTLGHTLETILILLHPFMPFVTEEIWSMLPDIKTPLIVATWPE